eukprot:tig00000140_g8459.t1
MPSPVAEPSTTDEQLRMLQNHASGALDEQFAEELSRETDLVELIKRLVSTHYSHMCFEHAGELAARVRSDVNELNGVWQILSPLAKELGCAPYSPGGCSIGTGNAVKLLIDRAGALATTVDPNLRMLEDINAHLYPTESFPTRFALIARLKKDVQMTVGLKPAALSAAKALGLPAGSPGAALEGVLGRLAELEARNLELKRENKLLKEKKK